MTWLKQDDGALTHPRTMHLRGLDHDIATAEAVIGFVGLAATWSGQHNTDAYIPVSVGPLASPKHWELLAEHAIKVGIMTRATVAQRKPHGGQAGWMVNIAEGEIFHLLSAEHVRKMRERRASARRNDVQIEVLLRDGDQCRYCDLPVNPKSSGYRGREFEHPDPDVGDVIVVACRKCNERKGGRTVEQAGMTLLPAPAERGLEVYLTQHSRDWLARRDALPLSTSVDVPTVARPATGTAATDARAASATAASAGATDQPTTQPTTRAAPVTGEDPHLPGRVGSGRAAPACPPPTATAARRRTRGKRGRRGRPVTPPPEERSA